MTFDAHVDLGYALIATPPSPATSGQTLTFAAGAVLPAAPFNAWICPADTVPTPANSECIRVTGLSGLQVTSSQRGQEGTSPRTILAGDQVIIGVTAKTLTDIETAIAGEIARALSAESTLAGSIAIVGTLALGGDLTGSSLPNPVLAAGSVTSTKIADGTIVNADINAAAAIAEAKLALTVGTSTLQTAITAETARAQAAEAKLARLAATAAKTGAYAATAGQLVPVDATSGTIAVTLPTAPAEGTQVAVKKIDASANTVTIVCGGSDVFNKTGGSTTLTILVQNEAMLLQYSAAGAIWYLLAGDTPIGGLDTRYAPGRYPGATLLVASSNSTARAKASADYVCTGTNDDVVINSALAALGSNPGGVVLLAEGTYTIGNLGIQILNGAQQLRGLARRGATYLVGAVGSTCTQPITIGTAGTGNLFNNSVSNLSIDGTNFGSSATAIVASSNMFLGEDLYIQSIGNGISVLSQTTTEFAFQSLRNVEMYQITNDGVKTDANIVDLMCEKVTCGGVFNVTPGGRYGFNLNGGYITLIGCRAHDFNDGWGVFATGAFMLTIVGGHFDENGKTATGGGIHCDSTSRATISSCKFNSNANYDVYFSNTSNSSITGNQMNGAGTKGPNTASINVAGCTNVIVANNNVVDMQVRGIVVSSSSSVTVHDNAVSNPTAAATQASIRFFSCTNCCAHHNPCSNGIVEDGSSDFNLFEQNYLSGGTLTTVGAHTVVIPWLTAPVSSNPGYPWLANNLNGWTFDPALSASSGNAPAASSFVVSKMMVPATITIANIVSDVVTAGSGLTANQCFAMVFSSAGVLLCQTPDMSGTGFTVGTTSGSATVTGTGFTQGMVGATYAIAGVAGSYTVSAVASGTSLTMSTTVPTTVASAAMTPSAANSWLSTGSKTTPVVTPATVTGSPTAYVYIAYISNGTTQPALCRAPGNDGNQNVPSGAGMRFGKITGTFTSVPSSFTPSSLVSTFQYWGGTAP